MLMYLVMSSALLLQAPADRALQHDFTPDVKGMQAACDADQADSCFGLGLTWEFGAGVDIDLAKAKDLYQRACDLKYGVGCAALGSLDPTHNPDLLNKACDYKYGQACFDSALQPGVVPQSAPWMDFLQRACDDGFGPGCTKMADSANPERVKLLGKACDLDDAAGCYLLGQMYSTGNGVQKDVTLSQRLFDKACTLFFPAPGCKEFESALKSQ
jgi:uncharacterized protein